MRIEQRPIAQWMNSVLTEKGWTAYRWAKATGGKVNATTIKRAMSEGYEGVTSIRIITDLADAADAEMPSLGGAPSDAVLSEAVLREVLPVVLATMELPQPNPEDLDEGAGLLRSALVFLAGDQETAADPTRARLAVRALAKVYGH